MITNDGYWNLVPAYLSLQAIKWSLSFVRQKPVKMAPASGRHGIISLKYFRIRSIPFPYECKSQQGQWLPRSAISLHIRKISEFLATLSPSRPFSNICLFSRNCFRI